MRSSWWLGALLLWPCVAHADVEQALVDDNTGIFQMQFLIGSWQCEGQQIDLVSGASVAVKAQWDVKYSCENHWVTETFKSNVAGTDYTAWGWITYDPNSRTLVRDVTDSLGNWARTEAGGWADNMLVWRGGGKSPADVAIDLRSVITKQAVNRLWIADMERVHTHPRWYDTLKLRCRRAVTPGARPLADDFLDSDSSPLLP